MIIDYSNIKFNYIAITPGDFRLKSIIIRTQGDNALFNL